MSARRTATAAAAAVPAAAPAAEAAEATGRRQRNATPFAATAAAPAANGTGANAGAFRDDLLKPVTGGRIPVTNSAPPPKVKSQKNGDPLKMTLRKVFTAYMGLPTDERKRVHEAEGFAEWLKKTRAFVDDWTRLGEQLTGKKQPGFVDARFASLFSPAILAKYNLKLGDAVVYEEGAKEPTNVGLSPTTLETSSVASRTSSPPRISSIYSLRSIPKSSPSLRRRTAMARAAIT